MTTVRLALGGRERAVAFVDIDCLAYERNAEMLLPFAGGEFARGLHGFAERFRALGFLFHRFDENPAVEFLRRLDPKKVENSGREIEVAARQRRRDVFSKIRP